MKMLFQRQMHRKPCAVIFCVLVLAGSVHAEEFRFDLNTDPMQFIVGPNARLDIRISESWSIGPAFYYENRVIRAVQVNEFASGLYLSFAFAKSKTHHWYLEAGALYGILRASFSDVNGNVDTAKLANWTNRELIGHQWYFGHFSLDVGGGVETNSAGYSTIKDNLGNEVATIYIPSSHGVLETSIGFAF